MLYDGLYNEVLYEGCQAFCTVMEVAEMADAGGLKNRLEES